MAVGSIGLQLPSGSNVMQIAQQIAAALDTNGDQQISTAEFASFLTQFLNGARGGSGAQTPASGGGQASSLTTASEIPPSEWTDNNAPYGVTFAGFSPQDHTDLTLADLARPTFEKYAAYDYLLSNQVQATNDWAPAAAAALNRQTSSSVFAAIDGETLGYGDEYIHSASNGYGMARGTYNANATGEFFWGAA
jgi:hypothetical protein